MNKETLLHPHHLWREEEPNESQVLYEGFEKFGSLNIFNRGYVRIDFQEKEIFIIVKSPDNKIVATYTKITIHQFEAITGLKSKEL